jgi:hypothetical protein
MATFIEGCTVPVAELAKVLKVTVAEVEAEATALGLFVGSDWAGLPALSAVDAHALTSGAARRDRDHAAAQLEFSNALEDWRRRREEVRQKASREAFDDGLRRGVGNSKSSDAAHAAGREAVAKFDRANPEPAWRDPAPRPRGPG